MKKNGLILLVFFSIFCSNIKAFAFSASFDQKISMQGNVVAKVKVIVKDKNVRAESNLGGNPNVIIRNEKGTFNYIPSQNMAAKIPDPAEKRDPVNDLSDFMGFLKTNNAKVVGSETVEGKVCDIYQFADPTTGAESKAWVWKEKNFPVRIQVATTVGATTIDFENIELNPKIDMAVFQLPANVQITQLEIGTRRGAAAPPEKPAQ